MSFTEHGVLVERLEKWISSDYWSDVNLNSVKYLAVVPISDGDISFYEPALRSKPTFREVVLNKEVLVEPQVHTSDSIESENENGSLSSPMKFLYASSLHPKKALLQSTQSHNISKEVPHFIPLSTRELRRKAWGPSWTTKWFCVKFKLTKYVIRTYRDSICLRWDSDSEAMLYSSTGRSLSGYTGGNGCDRRDLVYLATTLPKLDKRPVINSSNILHKDIMDGTESIMSGDSLTGHRTYNDDNDTVELCYYVEMCCNGMFGCGNNGLISPPNEHRTWDILMCDVVIVNEAAQALLWDMRVLHDVAKHLPAPNTVGIQAANVANSVINHTVVTSQDSLMQAREMIKKSEVFMYKKKMVDSSTQSRSMNSGRISSDQQFSHFAVQKDFKIDHDIIAVGHCHIDCAWLWPYAETRRKVARSWATQLELFNRHHYKRSKHHSLLNHSSAGSAGEGGKGGKSTSTGTDTESLYDDNGNNNGNSGSNLPGSGSENETDTQTKLDLSWKFVASQAVQYEWLKEDQPELWERVKEAVRQEAFLPIGGSYTEFDANMPSGESMVRQMLYGLSFFKKEMGGIEEAEGNNNAHKNRADHVHLNIPTEQSASATPSLGRTLGGGASRPHGTPGGTPGHSSAEISPDLRPSDHDLFTPDVSKKGPSEDEASSSSKAVEGDGMGANNAPRYASATESSKRKQKSGEIRESMGKSYQPPNIFWLPDTFGYSGNLPQIMRGFHMPYFLSQKLSWNLTSKFKYSNFIWEGIDGSSVIAHFPPTDTYNSLANVEEILRTVNNHSSSKDSNRSLLLFGHGDGGGGIHEHHLQHLERLQRCKGMPHIDTDVTPTEFFQCIERDFHLGSEYSGLNKRATLEAAHKLACVQALAPADKKDGSKEAAGTDVKFKVSGEIVITKDNKEVKSPDKSNTSGTSIGRGTHDADDLPVNSADHTGMAQITTALHHYKVANHSHPSQSHSQLQVPRAAAPPRWVGELYLQLHQGTLTSQASIKKQNRQIENLMRSLEALMVYAALGLEAMPPRRYVQNDHVNDEQGDADIRGNDSGNTPYTPLTTGVPRNYGHYSNNSAASDAFSPDRSHSTPLPSHAHNNDNESKTPGPAQWGTKEVNNDILVQFHSTLKTMWKTLLLNQFHDVLPGSSIEAVYQDSNHMLSGVMQQGYNISQQLIEMVLPSHNDTANNSNNILLQAAMSSSSVRDVVFNGTSFDRWDYYPRVNLDPTAAEGQNISESVNSGNNANEEGQGHNDHEGIPSGQYEQHGDLHTILEAEAELEGEGDATPSHGNSRSSSPAGPSQGAFPGELGYGIKHPTIPLESSKASHWVSPFSFSACIPVAAPDQENVSLPPPTTRSTPTKSAPGGAMGDAFPPNPPGVDPAAGYTMNSSYILEQYTAPLEKWESTGVHGEVTEYGYKLENSVVVVKVNPQGLLLSIVDKRMHPPREMLQQYTTCTQTHNDHSNEYTSQKSCAFDEVEVDDEYLDEISSNGGGNGATQTQRNTRKYTYDTSDDYEVVEDTLPGSISPKHNKSTKKSSPHTKASNKTKNSKSTAHKEDIAKDNEEPSGSGRGNLLMLHDDLPFFWDAWDVFPYHTDTGYALNLWERGHARTPLEVDMAIHEETHKSTKKGKKTSVVSSKRGQKANSVKSLSSILHNKKGIDNHSVADTANTDNAGNATRIKGAKKAKDGRRYRSLQHGQPGQDGEGLGLYYTDAKSSYTTTVNNNSNEYSLNESPSFRYDNIPLSNFLSVERRVNDTMHPDSHPAALSSYGQSSANNATSNNHSGSRGGNIESVCVRVVIKTYKERDIKQDKDPRLGDREILAGVGLTSTTLPTSPSGQGTSPSRSSHEENASLDRTCSTIIQVIRLQKDSPTVIFENIVDWAEQHKILKVNFPCNIRATQANYEIQSGVLQRPTHTNTDHDKAQYEVCGQRFAALQEAGFGIALLNDCKYGYSCQDNTLSLSLLRSPKSPDGRCDMGVHFFKYVVMPFAGNVCDRTIVDNSPLYHEINYIQNSNNKHPNANTSYTGNSYKSELMKRGASVLSTASMLNSPLLVRDRVTELTPQIQRLVDSMPWQTVQGYTLAQVLPIEALSSWNRSGKNTVLPSPHVYIDCIKLAESFEFYEPTKIQRKKTKEAMFPIAVHYAQSHPLTPSSVSKAGEQYRGKAHVNEGAPATTPLRFDSTTQHADNSNRVNSQSREYRNKDVVIRLVEMNGCRGVCAMQLHPHLMARVKGAYYAYMDESTYGKKKIRKIRPKQGSDAIPGRDRNGSQEYLEIHYEPYKIITVRLVVE